MSIEVALKIESDLRQKLDIATQKLNELDRPRADLAFGAHTGDNTAKLELDALNRKRAALALDIDSLATALAEAERRVAAARREVELEAERERARQVRAIADAMTARGDRIAEAAHTLRDEIRRLDDDLERMRRLGAPVANGRLVALAMTRAILPLLREAGLEVELIPPGHRHDTKELIAGYVGAAAAWADKVLAVEAINSKQEAA
jgi:hypothetical protein